ncbi:MAG: hypothetical protein M1391_08025 [Bacteroidetes bacterium]|nr:hypothetical protein [Bacteroidota bacterium]
MLLPGLILFLLGIIIFFYLKHNIIKPSYVRPLIFTNELFLNISTLVWIILLISGTILIIYSSIILGIIIVSIVILYIVVLKFIGNDYSIIKTNYEVYHKLKKHHPNKDEKYYLFLVAKSRYPNRSDQDILNIIGDSSDIDQLIKTILRIDKPFYQTMDANQQIAFLENYRRLIKKVLKKMKVNE